MDSWESLTCDRYQRAFVDFFEDQLVASKYRLKELLDEFLLGGKEPLINGLVSGRKCMLRACMHMANVWAVAHPLIHLGYAYELESTTVAIEALALGACFYNPLHKYIDDPSYTKPSPRQSTSLFDLLDQVREDKRFDGLYDHRSGDISRVFEEREDALLEYWNAWDLTDPKEQFHASQDVAVAILMGTETPNDTKFDFFFVHALTSSHAVRVLLPLVPAKFHLSLVRQWWLFTLAVYIGQTRPKVDVGCIHGYELKGRDWKFVVHKALNGPNASDAHFVKGTFG